MRNRGRAGKKSFCLEKKGKEKEGAASGPEKQKRKTTLCRGQKCETSWKPKLRGGMFSVGKTEMSSGHLSAGLWHPRLENELGRCTLGVGQNGKN